MGTADNGNVVSITNNRDVNRMQNFTYDSMNRIATAYTSGNLWGETFQIDQWGNLNKILPYSGRAQGQVSRRLSTSGMLSCSAVKSRTHWIERRIPQ